MLATWFLQMASFTAIQVIKGDIDSPSLFMQRRECSAVDNRVDDSILLVVCKY